MAAEQLLIDLGSSRLKWQWRGAAGEVSASGSTTWTENSQIPGLPAGRLPVRIWLARVGPPARETALCRWLQEAYGPVPVQLVQPVARGPGELTLAYDPSQFGVDRYCALLAVLAQTRSPAVVIDAGTAVTVDVLAAGGEHLGGYIVPGLYLGLKAVMDLFSDDLQRRVAAEIAASLREFAVFPDPGHSTAEALARGWSLGLHAAIAGLVAGLRDGAQGTPVGGLEQAASVGSAGTPEVWLTGGDGPWLARHWGGPSRVVPDLVLDGIWAYASAAA